ncbi:MAG: transcriptional repressor [bacterium]|nr:transcriptional repressor [Myxococcales bacterium]MCB9544023.1 transcriptional repressor [Myxococcales bacterium]
MLKAEEAVDTLRAYLVQQGLKFTHQRRLITEVFFDPLYREAHPSVEDLYDRVRERDQKVGYATVYRTLKLLVECGLANPNRLGDNQTRFEPESPGEHHDHLVCTTCGAVFEFEEDEIERLQNDVARRFGMTLSNHRMVLYGYPGDDCTATGCQRDGAPPTATTIEL